jgi:hypothetical protein
MQKRTSVIRRAVVTMTPAAKMLKTARLPPCERHKPGNENPRDGGAEPVLQDEETPDHHVVILQAAPS